MATTIGNIIAIVVLITIVCLALTIIVGGVYGLWKVVVWCWRYSFEMKVGKFLSMFDNHDLDLTDALIESRAVNVELEARPRQHGVRGWQRIRKDNMTQIAYGLADEAFLFFGTRNKNKANDIITRKWMRDHISKFDSLRAKDKSTIIEMALTLSYVAPVIASQMRDIVDSDTYKGRVVVDDSYTQ